MVSDPLESCCNGGRGLEYNLMQTNGIYFSGGKGNEGPFCDSNFLGEKK